ncbi:MAG: hypothetical protein Rhob2KO_54230 [Rhodopirellula baltica]
MPARVHCQVPSIEANVGWNRRKTQTVESPTRVTEAKDQTAYQRETAQPNVSNPEDVADQKTKPLPKRKNFERAFGDPMATDRRNTQTPFELGPHNGRFLRHRPERSGRCLNYERLYQVQRSLPKNEGVPKA